MGVSRLNLLDRHYARRHGLKESELWSMLATIQEEERTLGTSSVGDTDGDARALVQVCYGYRGALEDTWRTHDPMQKGVITRSNMLKGMKKVNQEFTNDDLTLLLVRITCSHQTSTSTSFISCSHR